MQHFSIRKQLACLLLLTFVLSACGKPHQFSGTEFPDLLPAPEIVGQFGDSVFRLSEHKGKVVAIFFGFTFCPDICPLTLSEIERAYKQAEALPEDVAVVFVTIDPERDTPEAAKTYAAAFNKDFIGVHVPVAEQESLKKAYFLFAEKQVEEGKSAGNSYLVAHTDNVYLIDREGNWRAVYRSSDLVVEDFAADLSHLIAN